MVDFAACAEGIMQAYNDKDFARLRAAVAPDLTMAHFNRGASFTNVDDLIALMEAFASDLMPDRRFEPAEAVHVADTVVIREGYWSGTAQQDLPGFAESGEALRLRLCSVMTFDDAGILIDWKDHG